MITGGNSSFGGGMNNASSNPTVTGCSFTGNTANFAEGGAMKSFACNLTVTNCTFSGNPADIDGRGDVGVVDLLAVLGGWGGCS